MLAQYQAERVNRGLEEAQGIDAVPGPAEKSDEAQCHRGKTEQGKRVQSILANGLQPS
jgi:hypothetical protein